MLKMDKKIQFSESIDTFKVSFLGDAHTIDAELFTRTINNTIDLVKASAHAIDPNSFLRLEIRANKEGSFDTIIDAIVRNGIDLFTKDNARFAAEIVGGYLAFLQIKAHLKGKKAKRLETKDDSTAIVNQDNTVIKVPEKIADNFFKDCKIENSIIQIFTDLGANDREGFSVEHGDKKISFSKEQYDLMTERTVDAVHATSKVEKQDPFPVNLLLKKVDFMGNSAWEFFFNKVISAKIEDKDFLDRVKAGEIKIYAGVKLPCLLQIEYELDENLNPIPNSDRYTITKVTGNIIEPVKETNANLFG